MFQPSYIFGAGDAASLGSSHLKLVHCRGGEATHLKWYIEIRADQICMQSIIILIPVLSQSIQPTITMATIQYGVGLTMGHSKCGEPQSPKNNKYLSLTRYALQLEQYLY